MMLTKQMGNSMLKEYADVLDTFIYRLGVSQGRFSFAAAAGLFKSIVNFALLLGSNYVAGKFGEAQLSKGGNREMAKNPNKIRAKRVASDYVIDIIMIVTIVLVLVLTLYPFLNSLAISLNDSNDTTLGGLTIYPRKVYVEKLRAVSQTEDWMAYFITIARTVIGTVGGVLITGMLAFAISRTNLVGKKVYAMLCLIPMYFGGGLMPTYFLILSLGLKNNFLVYIIRHSSTCGT